MGDEESTQDWRERVRRDAELVAKALFDSRMAEADPLHIGPETAALIRAQTDALFDAVMKTRGDLFEEITARLQTIIACLVGYAAQCARELEALGRPVRFPEHLYPPDIVPPDAG